ncbi:hypothetical protein CIRG_09111 [Coccidioides immitis RMSCC 2394]|uniref:Uncharacterized protein n=1 Tax=Coccidioides immitis RMSCC 2394 TaxID=404692 RepID=A0A0J6YSB9_COCIT|nr:hypothetical protein CIRG_09111 [Coccidioides immitis RMSCC 2394]
MSGDGRRRKRWIEPRFLALHEVPCREGWALGWSLPSEGDIILIGGFGGSNLALFKRTMGRRNVIILEQRPEDLDALPPALRRKRAHHPVSWCVGVQSDRQVTFWSEMGTVGALVDDRRGLPSAWVGALIGQSASSHTRRPPSRHDRALSRTPHSQTNDGDLASSLASSWQRR